METSEASVAVLTRTTIEMIKDIGDGEATLIAFDCILVLHLEIFEQTFQFLAIAFVLKAEAIF